MTPRRLNTYLVKFVDDYNDLAPELYGDDDEIIRSIAHQDAVMRGRFADGEGGQRDFEAEGDKGLVSSFYGYEEAPRPSHA